MLKRSTKIMWVGMPFISLVFIPEVQQQIGETAFIFGLALGIVIYLAGLVYHFAGE